MRRWWRMEPRGPLLEYCLLAWHLALIPVDPPGRASRTRCSSVVAPTSAAIRKPARDLAQTQLVAVRCSSHPIIETLVLALGIRLISLLTKHREAIAITSALRLGCVARVFLPIWFFGTAWSFYVFSRRLLAWQLRFIQTFARRRGRAARARERIRAAGAVLRRPHSRGFRARSRSNSARRRRGRRRQPRASRLHPRRRRLHRARRAPQGRAGRVGPRARRTQCERQGRRHGEGQGRGRRAAAAARRGAQRQLGRERSGASPTVQAELDDLLLGMPNLLHESVPDGRDESANRGGAPLGRAAQVRLQAARITSSSARSSAAWISTPPRKISGARFSVMKGGVARLHRALAQFMLDLHTREHGYTEVYVPYLVQRASAAGHRPAAEVRGRTCSRVQGEQGFYLIPTAEVPVTNLVRDRSSTRTSCR